MGSVTKRKESFLARAKVMKNYIVKTKSKTFKTKTEAWAWIEKTEKAMRFGQTEEIDHTKTLKDAIIRYRNDVSPSKKGGPWEILRLNAFLKQKTLPIHLPLSKLNARHIAEWRDSRKISNSSKNRELSLLRVIFEKCIDEWLWLENNPIKSIKRLKEPSARNRRISDQEITAILNELNFEEDKYPAMQKQKVAIAFLLALETGMRQGEIANLNWSNIYLNQKYLTLPDTKNGDNRDVPLSRRAIELLEYLHPKRSGPVFDITADVICTLFRRAVSNCEIQNLRFHDTRHEACTRLARKLNVLDLAKMIGHRDPRSLMIYYNPTATEIADRLG